MSHRIYLYNLNNEVNRPVPDVPAEGSLESILPVIGSHDSDSITLMEWKYEFPFFLHPLFADNPYLGTPAYNGQNGGIYAGAPQGITALKRLYDFIDTHAEVLTDDPAAFRSDKQQIFDFLDKKIAYTGFHLDAWDVFNMSDEPHEAQAAELLEQIRNTNAAIEAAIAANDPLLLNECPDVQQNPYHFKTFRDFFSTSAYRHGWNVIRSGYYEPVEEDSDQEAFTENGFTGLKIHGEVVIPAEYDEVFIFPEHEDFAVVNRGGKWGYVNRQGQLVSGLVYDMADDVTNGHALVKSGEQFYLLLPGAPISGTGYEDVSVLSEEPLLYAACRQGRYGVIDAAGHQFLPFAFTQDIELLYYSDINLFAARHVETHVRHYYTPSFTRIGDDSIDEVSPFGSYNKGTLFQFVRRKPQPRYGLFTADGKELLPVMYDELEEITGDALVVRQGANSGIWSVSHGWQVPLSPISLDPIPGYACIINQDGKQGIYISANKIIPPVYDTIAREIVWQDNGDWHTIAVNTAGVFSITHQSEVTQLTTADIAAILITDNRYRYSDELVSVLIQLAGDDIPDDLLYQKGADALDAQQYEDAIRYYKKAAGKGNKDAMNDLGFLYETIDGYIDDMAAFDWYSRGVAAGSSHAANGLGNCYQHGIGTSPDIRRALELYQQAASQHIPHANYNLGMLYYEGIKVPKDDHQALKHFVYASRFGIDCYNYIGTLSEVAEDYKSAVDAYRSGIKNKDEYCAFNMARLYELGLGVKPDARKALSHYMKAVDFGMEDALLELRRMYLYNEDVKDEVRAKQYEQQARDAGLDIPE
ncbi:SEL1-like repeat protein [Chitinophaga varians]|uniref:SEL1-like repeat protein n=1 Tax=Chitinophaga varians TaxID=2202339 RepID=UPI00165F58B9|nr:SEL1-like repeat protein [Chitinophaga varians]MBC9914959.1 SEL1-like repeat protein [Chitinophaga varians]